MLIAKTIRNIWKVSVSVAVWGKQMPIWGVRLTVKIKWIHGDLGTTSADSLEFRLLQAVNNWQKRQYKPPRVSTRPAKYNICTGKRNPLLLLVIYSAIAQNRTLNISRTSNATIGNNISTWCVFVRPSLHMRREEKNQLDVTVCFIELMIRSTCFGHFYAHHQEL